MAKRWKKNLAFFTAAMVFALLLVCAAAVVLLYSYDFNRLKPYIYRSVKEASGQELVIEGDIRVRPGLPMVLSAERLRLANAAQTGPIPQASAERLEVGVRLWPLLRKRLVLSRVKLVEPQVRFDVGSAVSPVVVPETKNQIPHDPNRPPPLVVERLQVQNGNFAHLEDGAARHNLVLKAFDLQQRMLSDTYRIDFTGTFDDQPVQINGTLTQLPGFLFADEMLSFDLEAESRSTRVAAAGRMLAEEASYRLESRVKADGDTVMDVLRFFGIEDFPEFGPFRLDGAVSGPLASLAGGDIELQAGSPFHPKTRIRGRIGHLNRFRDVALDFECHDTQFESVERVLDANLPLKGPYRLAGRFEVPAEDRYRFADLQMTLGENRLRGALELDGSVAPLQMSVSLSGPRIDLRPLAVELPAPAENYADLGPIQFDLAATAPFDTLKAETIRLAAGSSDRIELNLDGSIENLPALTGLTLAWRIRGSRLQGLGALLGQTWPDSGAFHGSGKLRSPSPQRYRIDELKIAAAGSDLQGFVDLDRSANPMTVDAVLNSKRLDLTPFIAKNLPAGREQNKDPSSSTDAFLPASISAIHTRVDYRAAEVRAPGFKLPEVTANLNLKEADLAMSVEGPQLPDILPYIKLAQLGDYRFDLEVTAMHKPSPSADFALSAGDPDKTGLQIQGSTADLSDPYPVQMQIAMQVATAGQMAAIVEKSLPLEAPLKLGGKLEVASRETYRWSRLEVRAGPNRLNGDLILALNAARPQIKATLHLPVLSVPSLSSTAVKNPDAKPAGLQPMLFDMLQPCIRAMQALDFDAVITADKILFDGFEIREPAVDGRLKAGNLQLSAVSQSIPDVARATGIEGLPDLGPIDLELRARASGDTLALDSLDGSAGIAELARAEIRGKSANLAELSGSELQVRVEGENFPALQPYFESLPGYEGAFRLEGRLTNPQTRRLRIGDFNVNVGDSQVSGRLEFDLRPVRPEVVAELQSPMLDLVPLFLWLRPQPVPEAQQQNSAKRKRVLPDAPLPLAAFKALDARLQLQADRVLTPALDMQKLVGTVRIQDGHMLVDPFRFESGQGRVDGQIVLRQTAQGAVVSQKLRVAELHLDKTLAEMEIDPLFTGRLNAEVDLTGRGRNVAELLASLDGRFLSVASNGRFDNRYFAPFLLDPNIRTILLRSVNPFYQKEKYTDYNCLVNRLEFEDGAAKWSGFLDTDRVYLTMGGTVNLQNEDIDIAVAPKPKEGLGLEQIGKVSINLGELSKPFKIRGTLANPSLSFAPSRAALTIGKALGGFLLLGPVGLAAAFADVSIGKDNTCVQALENIGQPQSVDQESSDQGMPDQLGDDIWQLFEEEQ